MLDTYALCGREETLTRHHPISRTRDHDKKTFSRQPAARVVGFYRPCSKWFHPPFTEKELGRVWNSIEKLKTQPEFASFIA
jgi:hypothetical protein